LAADTVDNNGVGSSGNGSVPHATVSTSVTAAAAAAAAKLLEDSTTQTEIKLFPGVLSRRGHD
jgi:hypothetical protein